MIAMLLLASAMGGWQPPGISRTQAESAPTIAGMIAAAAAPAQRTERWTYHNGALVIPVDVAVRDADFRVGFMLQGLPYASGRYHQTHWRSNGNGVAHATQADLQGDAADHVPDAPFAIDAHDCRLIGQRDGGATLVVEDDEPYDAPRWLFVDAQTHRITREIAHEGRRVVTYAFDRGADGALRGWTVDDGDRTHGVTVTVDARDAAPVPPAAVAERVADRRTFIGPAGHTMRALKTTFRNDRIWTPVSVNGHTSQFIIDSGTETLTMDDDSLRRDGMHATLEHATATSITVGDETLTDAGLFTIPFKWGATGLLGYDWFFGQVVHINYQRELVEVGDLEAARAAFDDPKMVIVPLNTDQSIPFVTAIVDGVSSSSFAIDTGSWQLQIFPPFLDANPDVSAAWARGVFPSGKVVERDEYLEGSVDVAARRIGSVQLGPIRFTDVTAGMGLPSSDLKVPFDGIIGTEMLRHYDLWFDYDRGRLGLRPVK